MIQSAPVVRAGWILATIAWARQASVNRHKAARRKFNLQPSDDNLNNFKIHRAKTRVTKTSKDINTQAKNLGSYTPIGQLTIGFFIA